jgi:hypothetical protein
MFDWLLSSETPAESSGSAASLGPAELTVRLLAALLLGLAVACIYRCSHGRRKEDARVLFATLVLLSLLIAMVALVIGNSVARAFSLVGALSIVRFRTVVDDTRDTAFVIFSVVVGMAAGAGLLFVPLLGLPLVAMTAIALDRWQLDRWQLDRWQLDRWQLDRWRPRWMARAAVGGAATGADVQSPAATEAASDRYVVQARIGVGYDPHVLLEPVFDRCGAAWRLRSLATARQGTVLDCVYAVRLSAGNRVANLLAELNRIEGVQSLEAVSENVRQSSSSAEP